MEGRLVNGYCRKDWLLAFVHRTMSAGTSAAGLAAVSDVDGLENVDLSGIVDGHLDYRRKGRARAIAKPLQRAGSPLGAVCSCRACSDC